MVNELKSCPFCGGKAEEWVCPFEDTGYIRCTECEARTRQTLTREEATEEWNTRADTTRLSELEAALRDIRDQEITELALDPDWPRRIASAALEAGR